MLARSTTSLPEIKTNGPPSGNPNKARSTFNGHKSWSDAPSRSEPQ